MTINSDVQAPVKLSVEEILEAILQLSSAEQTVLDLKLKRLGLYDSKPLPYVVKLEEGKSLEQILQERGYKGVNWARVDELAKEFNEIEDANIIKLHDDKPIDEQLDEIWQKRGPINWSNIDDISEKMSIEEPIEELLQTLNS